MPRLRIIGTVLAAVQLVAGAAVAETTVESCQQLTDDAERLACYDRVFRAGQAVPAEPAPTAPAPVEPAPAPTVTPDPEPPAPAAQQQPDTVPLDDRVGRESLDRDEKPKDPDIVGHVRSCKENARGRYFFFFDNGQVWKQVDNTPIRWRECNFEVRLRKDFFGYSLQPVGEKKKVRVSRVE